MALPVDGLCRLRYGQGVARKRSEVKELLGLRAVLDTREPLVWVEDRIDGFPTWRVVLKFWGLPDGRIVLGELRVFPAGDRTRYLAGSKHPRPGDRWLDPGVWSEDPEVLVDVPGDGIPAEALRAIHPRPYVRAVREQIRASGSWRPAPGESFSTASIAELWQAIFDHERSKPQRERRGEPYYAIWAAAAAALDGDPKINEALAEQFGETPRRVAQILFRARELGLLTSNGQGRPGGKLTKRGRAVLTELEKQGVRR
jgi:hypothetical protein